MMKKETEPLDSLPQPRERQKNAHTAPRQQKERDVYVCTGCYNSSPSSGEGHRAQHLPPTLVGRF